MSAGHPRLTTGIPMGKPTGMETRGSESLAIAGLHGSGFLFWGCEYLPQVLVRLGFYFIYLLIFIIIMLHILIFFLSVEHRSEWFLVFLFTSSFD